MGWLIFLLWVIAVGVAVWYLVRRVTVFEYERGLRYTKGVFERVLAPGQYWYFTPLTAIRKIDIRQRFVSVGGQEVLTADSVSIRLSLAATYQVDDPEAALHEVEDYESAMYLTLQMALRDIVGSYTIDDLLAKRQELATKLLEKTQSPVGNIGVKLIAVDIKDITFPGPLKQTFAQVVVAQKEGLAALERARGESAALRNLSNAARMLDGNPSLWQLRLLQAVDASSGNSIMIDLGEKDSLPGPSKPKAKVAKKKSKSR